MRRTALSITSNIAEGFGRYSKKDNLRFYYLAISSLTELQNQFILARDLQDITKNFFQEFAKRSVSVHKLLNGSIKSLHQYF